MLPSVTVSSATLEDGTEFTLGRRDNEWFVRVGSMLLMSSRAHASEEALAEHALARVVEPRRILLGGLGLGFTLRAVLDRVPATATITVSELVPALVAWNREHVGDLASHPLDDKRCNVVVGDVFDEIKRGPEAFDVILLDVDNGPMALSNPKNQRLYGERGVAACHRALGPNGVLAVWSRGPNARFERLLHKARFDVEVLRVRAFKTGRASHVLFLGTRRT